MLSYKENIPRILEAAKYANSKKILDIGCAFGKYGLLLREQYLSGKAEQELIPNDDMQIDAMEYTKYFTDRPALKHIYNKLYKTDMFESIDKINEYDLVLLIDVVEHYSLDKVKDFLSKIKGRVLVSTPKKVHMYTEHFYGDPHHHVSQWNETDFSGWKDFSNEQSYIYLRN